MAWNDARQQRLRELFSELRRIKQQAMPEDQGDPVSQAYHDERVKAAIVRIEERIEREMRE